MRVSLCTATEQMSGHMLTEKENLKNYVCSMLLFLKEKGVYKYMHIFSHTKIRRISFCFVLRWTPAMSPRLEYSAVI